MVHENNFKNQFGEEYQIRWGEFHWKKSQWRLNLGQSNAFAEKDIDKQILSMSVGQWND